MKTLTKRIISAVFAVLLTVPLLTGCGKSKEREVTININPTGLDQFVLHFAHEQGLFEKYIPEGVTVKYTYITSATEERDALITGQLDVTGLPVLSLTTSLQNNMPIAYMTFLGSGFFQLYAQDEDIQSIVDLNSSHRISVSSIGVAGHIAFLLAVQADGRDVSDFDNSMITMTNSDAAAALISGAEGVDAAVISFPTLLTVWQVDNIHLVKDLTDEITKYGPGTVLCTRQDFMEENLDIMDAVLQAFNEAVDIISSDPEAAIEVMMGAYEGCDHDTAAKMIDYLVNSIQGDTGRYDKLMSFLYEVGVLEEPAELFENIPKYEAAK